MNILVLNWQDRLNPLAGGAEVHLHEVFSVIARQGHHVTLLCSTFPGSRAEEVVDGIRVLRSGGRHLFNFVAFRRYLGLLRTARFDVVVDDMNKIPFLTPLYVRKPLVCVTHHLFGRSIFRETNPLIGSYVWGMEHLAVALFRRRRTPVVVGSHSTRDELVSSGIGDVTVVHYAVDHAHYRPTGVRRAPVPTIGYFGRLKRYKSIDQLLRAIPRIRQRVPDIRALIVGEGDDRARLEALARELGLSGVEFTGFVSEERKVELLQEVWLKVTTSSKEGWGLTVLEANACGTPAVASNVPGLREAVLHDETGLLYEYGDTAGLAEAVTRLLTDHELRGRFGERARSFAATFTWERAARETMAVLERVAGLAVTISGGPASSA